MNSIAQFCGCGAAMRPIHHIGNQSLFLCRDGHSTKVTDCEVNEDFTRDLYFSDLPSFKVDSDISIEDNVLTEQQVEVLNKQLEALCIESLEMEMAA